MKVRVVLTVDVDADAWRDEYSDHDLTNAEIREAVRQALVSAANQDGIIAAGGVIRDAWLEGTDR